MSRLLNNNCFTKAYIEEFIINFSLIMHKIQIIILIILKLKIKYF